MSNRNRYNQYKTFFNHHAHDITDGKIILLKSLTYLHFSTEIEFIIIVSTIKNYGLHILEYFIYSSQQFFFYVNKNII